MSLFLYQDQTFSIPPGRWKGFRLAGRQPVCTAGLVQEDNTNFSELPWFVIIHHHSSSFSSILSICSIAMTCNDYTYTIWEYSGYIWGIPWIFSISFSLNYNDFHFWPPAFGTSWHHGTMAMPRRCLDAEAMAPGHFTHASLYLCFATSLAVPVG